VIHQQVKQDRVYIKRALEVRVVKEHSEQRLVACLVDILQDMHVLGRRLVKVKERRPEALASLLAILLVIDKGLIRWTSLGGMIPKLETNAG